ncbi:right-handed parallel beta-helix repeat-containing protein [Sunxiuqinia sp. sy24]|uniref:right-handed parallel beta-helix repeat-containing protein n=1 Tax=Sunxiuqinia sp. sy24 TaxID=3461495 RepID=UPI004045D1B6
MRRLLILLLLGIFINTAFAKEYHVSKKGDDQNPGSFEKRLKTIQSAANLAQPGDVITVYKGTYREWVNPPRGGNSDAERIVYRAAEGEKVEIKGSEVITGWEKLKNGVWKVTIPNSFFGEYNPYQDSIFGDWFHNHGRIHHTGEVFLNGKSLYEKENMEKVFSPVPDTKIQDPEGSTYTWYCESDDKITTIWANFHQHNPNKELVEISTRRTCFYPEKPGINYLTIRGFHISQAATQWGAPTAEQIGMIATHWNKGWIIEDNVIHDSKCSGITLGKERGTGHNVWSANPKLDGSLHYIEVTFNTLRNGWSKENIGSHVVRNNEIFNCEQTGMCGSMGAAFSTIENNHIHDVWTKRQFSGAEIGGIKFHAAIDAVIKSNRIHSTGRGIWLDWMSQGSRVSKNLLYNNDLEDLFLEVNHGPTLVDNNLLLSAASIRNQSQGVAFVHNLIAGQICMWTEPNRFTPYHLIHSTEVAGLSTIFSGDDRYYNNILVHCDDVRGMNSSRFNFGVRGYENAKLHVWIDGNVYFAGSQHYNEEVNYIEKPDFNPELNVVEVGDEVYLGLMVDGSVLKLKNQLVTTQMLGRAMMPKQLFENPDGTPLTIDSDYFENKRNHNNPVAGPFENAKAGQLKLKVW